MIRACALMVQGTSSSVGKSLLVTALCRLFARQGRKVAPFKAQNMSNNAAVCPDDAEIGRAQALQALAAGIEPQADMNPVLLKPEGDCRSQVVVAGRVWKTLPARDYQERKRFLWSHVTAALDRLRSAYELVVIEGAGSPVELNLTAGDIVNMAVARYAGSPVLLVGDIDRGGVFAQLLGTLWLLPPEERALVRGLVVNKFRGDPSLFTDGLTILEQRGEVPVLGVVPFVPGLALPDEDAATLDTGRRSPAVLDIVVIRFPRIANFDDFDPLARERGVGLRYVEALSDLGRPHAIILPGTKSTLSDLQWIQERGLADEIVRLAAAGVAVVGVCGGYQMLGTMIRDLAGVESRVGEAAGLGLLPVETTFAEHKATHQVAATVQGADGWLATLTGRRLTGYEIHMGRTISPSPWLTIETRGGEACAVPDGAASPDGRVWGCYLHGLFANDEFRQAWLTSLRPDHRGATLSNSAQVEAAIDRLADAVAAAVSMERLERIIREGVLE